MKISEVGSRPMYAARCSRSAGVILAGSDTARTPARDFGGPIVDR